MSDSGERESELPLLGIDFVFEMGIRKIEEQLKEIEALDLKIGILFGFLGTVLVALLAVVFAAAPQMVGTIGRLEQAFLLIGLTSTLLAIISAFQAFRVRQSYETLAFDDLHRCANEEPKETKRKFLNTLLVIVNDNIRKLTEKRRYWSWANWSVLFAFLSFLSAIITRVVNLFVGI